MFTRYNGEVWDSRFLPRLTYKQIEEIDKENALVVLSIGAVEQHGYHLPLMTDSLIGEAFLSKTFEKLESDAPIWILPPLSYGKSNEHIGFAGTISLSSFTLQNVIMDIAKSLHKAGFKKFLLLNTHGGNVDLLNLVSREIRIETGMMVFYISPFSLDSFPDLIDEMERDYGIHGGDIETSVVQFLKPDWVQDEYAVCELPEMKQYEYITLENSIRFSWKVADISQSGVLGDATKASPEKGEIMMERVSDHLAKALLEICAFDVTKVKGTENAWETVKGSVR